MTRINPLQNDYAGLEAAIAQAMPSDFEEIVAEKQIFWKRELALIFGQAQLAEIIKRRVLQNYGQTLTVARLENITCSVIGS